MNLTRLLLISAAGSCVFLGCNRSAEPPVTTFRLTLQDIMTDTNARVALVTVQTASAGSISVDEGNGGSSVILPEPQGNSPREGSVVLMANRIAPPGEGPIYIQTLIRSQMRNGSAGGPSIYTLPRTTQLAEHFKITAKSGDYPLNTPVEIARLDGRPVTLSLKTSAK